MDMTCVEESPKQLIKPDLKEGLLQKRLSLESKLNDVNAAIKALDEHPEIHAVLELLGKATRGY